MESLQDLAGSVGSQLQLILATNAVLLPLICFYLFSRDVIIFFSGKRFGQIKVERLRRKTVKGVTTSIHRDIHGEQIDLWDLCGRSRYLFWQVVLVATFTKKNQRLINLDSIDKRFTKLLCDKLAAAGLDGNHKRDAGMPTRRVNYVVALGNDTGEIGDSTILRAIVVIERDLRNLPKECPRTPDNLSLFKDIETLHASGGRIGKYFIIVG